MSVKVVPRFLFALATFLVLAACASGPDLGRLYEGYDNNPDQPPVIIIHGLAGSTLVDAKTGKQFWPGSLSTLTFSNYRDLAQMSTEDREGEGLVPGDLFYSVAGVDFYAELLHSLETVGHFQRGVPGKAVTDDRRRYYLLVYDWRKDNMVAVRKLHALIEQIRLDYRKPDQKVDILAHSNGGLIANYYFRYGPNDVLEQPSFTTWAEGAARIRRLVMVGTPNLGAVTSLERLLYGTRMALRTVPVEVMATFATPFQALPHPLVKSILDPQGNPVDIDIYDPQVWRDRKWGVFSAELGDRVRGSMTTPAEGDKQLASLQDGFVHNLHRAERLQWALTAPYPTPTPELAVFGGDCAATPGHAVLLTEAAGSRLVFRPSQAKAREPGKAKRRKRDRPDFARLMYEPGDDLVTRTSQVARPPAGYDPAKDNFHTLPVSQSTFMCESHGRLTHNRYFQNNLLYFLLSR